MKKHERHPGRPTSRRGGFTLLELFVAFFLLATTVLPLLALVHQARIRANEYSTRREVQELAQQKLFERIYTYSEDLVNAGAVEALQGTFAEQGRPDWRWEIPYPETVNQGEQILLEYRILVFTPFGIGGKQSSGEGGDLLGGLAGSSYSSLSGEAPTFEMSTWALPSLAWYEEQQYLAEQGIDTGGYGYPGGLPAGAAGGLGGY